MKQNLIPRIGVGIVVFKDCKVLMGKRKNAHGAETWSFAGGHLEYGESIEDCAKRELLEETGLVAFSIQHGPWVNNIIDDKHYVTLFVFIDKFEGEPQLLEPHKCMGWHWFDWHRLPQPLFPPINSLITRMHDEAFRSCFPHQLIHANVY